MLSAPRASRCRRSSTWRRLLHPWVAFVDHADLRARQRRRRRGSRRARAIRSRSPSPPGSSSGSRVGIVVASWLAVRVGLARLPDGRRLDARSLGGGALAGIGFTMALFIAGLALRPTRAPPPRSGFSSPPRSPRSPAWDSSRRCCRDHTDGTRRNGAGRRTRLPRGWAHDPRPQSRGRGAGRRRSRAPAAQCHPRGPQSPDRGRPRRSAASCRRRSTSKIVCATS